jgi:hypothetical protein
MKIILATLLFATAVAFSQTSPAPERTAKSAARHERMDKLRTDLEQAGQRANFTAQQRQDFDAARETLRKQGENRRASGQTVDREAARQAMQTLRSLTASEAFQPQDRELLRKDLRDLRQGGRKGRARSAKPKPAA